MKKFFPAIFATALFVQGCSDNPGNNTQTGETTLSYTISQIDTFPNLPALQSFVFGQTNDAWLFIGGRTNGFHGFPNDGNDAFPRKKANKWIYAYTLSTHTLDSMSVDSLPAALKDQFSFTNIQHTQDGDSLYLCGGYGATYTSPNDSTFITDSTFSRVMVSQMVAAVKSHSGAQLRSSVVYAAQDNFVCATGGELFKINGRFYLTVGHRYQGAYNANTPPPGLQEYLDAVHSFTITQTTTSISLNTASYQTITDGLPDSTTQFRRRDLVVAPGMQTNGNLGISIYGGVFTSGNGTPFNHPIYVSVNGQTATYSVDTSHQYSNNYSAANLALYSKSSNKMYTTIFGGIVENAADSNNASFTKKVITVSHNLTPNTTTYTTESALMTASDNKFYGAESVFIEAANAPMYNATYGIVDFDALPANQPVVIGYVFGGIIAGAANNNGQSNSSASNKLFAVTVTRNVAGTPPAK
ncbi:MAG: hypothetical protein IM638_08725 [Bacteroidetes bacterium]|nr:hypothetical protein [Bacteroidota bacterium]